MDANGWVLISILASFNRIKNLTSDLAIVVECLRMTPLLEVSPKGTHVRLRQQWPEWVLPNATTNEDVKKEFEDAQKEKEKEQEKEVNKGEEQAEEAGKEKSQPKEVDEEKEQAEDIDQQPTTPESGEKESTSADRPVQEGSEATVAVEEKKEDEDAVEPVAVAEEGEVETKSSTPSADEASLKSPASKSQCRLM